MKKRDRRALVLGTIVMVLSVLGLRVLPWLAREHSGLRMRAEQQLATLIRTQAAVASISVLHDSLARGLNQFVQLAPKLIGGNLPGEAAASLSGTITLYTERSNMRAARLEPVADSTTDVMSPVSVRAELEGDAAGLSLFLTSVETGSPLLTVHDLVVRSSGASGNSRAPQLLTIEIEVTGWYMAEVRR